ncbi:phosphate starvation-inducible protein PhoH [Psychrobacillus sp. AK 1817]|uniref:Phosphate starvation-inducible protein PhoH n=1 Tax=Psychrobacillus faecigallinarum TaxID=2762235 RepID=A0ABR8RE29_9BACI|nr:MULTISPECIES: phosphate starvation-inducible protein PhoH [Psychrobacillus]MBD7946059.1 phosphate starvation-inducible protein PhoH [Psychrobacillus faecigallinarum]QEY21990.1 phosphate starvation-inducible protein PhoH [Psychrobacillus sp. AK 1817]
MANSNSILYLDPGHAFGLSNRTNPFMNKHFTIIDQYQLTQHNLEPYCCIVVHDFADQEYLYKNRAIIQVFLEAGKIVIFGGHLFREWLPGCPIFTPRTIESHEDYNVYKKIDHPIFEGVDTDDMTYNKGVAGFFARVTHSPVPAGSDVLLTFRDGMAITYIDRQSTKGTILVHSGRDLFAHRMQNKSTDRISTQLLQWIQDEYQVLQKGGSTK